jgi:CheY-like chemotaxis protein
MSGLELCRKVRAQPGLSDLRIALFTQSQSPEDLDRNRSCGADYFLTKDLLAQPADWLRRLEHILQEVHV